MSEPGPKDIRDFAQHVRENEIAGVPGFTSVGQLVADELEALAGRVEASKPSAYPPNAS